MLKKIETTQIGGAAKLYAQRMKRLTVIYFTVYIAIMIGTEGVRNNCSFVMGEYIYNKIVVGINNPF